MENKENVFLIIVLYFCLIFHFHTPEKKEQTKKKNFRFAQLSFPFQKLNYLI